MCPEVRTIYISILIVFLTEVLLPNTNKNAKNIMFPALLISSFLPTYWGPHELSSSYVPLVLKVFEAQTALRLFLLAPVWVHLPVCQCLLFPLKWLNN